MFGARSVYGRCIGFVWQKIRIKKMKKYDIELLEKLNQCEFRILGTCDEIRFVASYSKERDVFVTDFCGYWYPPTRICRKGTKNIYVLDLCEKDSAELVF